MPYPTLTWRLRWSEVYSEAELYKAALRVYTKPLFQWRKALATSTDGRTLYDLAARGLRNLDAIHRSLWQENFQFRPAVALKYNFNGRRRTLYISPWEERIVDLLLYRTLNRKLHGWFSAHSYAYRDRFYSLDRCQTRIAGLLRSPELPLYAVKRDIADYFASVDHELLLAKLSRLVEPEDYLYRAAGTTRPLPLPGRKWPHQAALGIPFGTAIACLLANMYLTDLDREMESIPGVQYFRYADDFLVLTPSRAAALQAQAALTQGVTELQLRFKGSLQADLLLSNRTTVDDVFAGAHEFRHLGLLFRAGGGWPSRVTNPERFRTSSALLSGAAGDAGRKPPVPETQAQALVEIAVESIEKGVRNVAILDYYLKHVDDEAQLRRLDRWLAEEVLSHVFGGHKKGHFRRIGFDRLRAMGLPSLVHRRRLDSARTH